MVEIKYVPTICPYCGTGCGLNFVVKDEKIVGVEPLKRHPVNEGKVCPKGNFGYQFINREDRLTTPLIKENGEFREASWDEALDLVANKLKEVSDEDPNKVGFYACARSPNENIYITQLHYSKISKSSLWYSKRRPLCTYLSRSYCSRFSKHFRIRCYDQRIRQY